MDLVEIVVAKKTCNMLQRKQLCEKCILHKELYEHSEHPTICEIIEKIENI
jgi:hypothetical protein